MTRVLHVLDRTCGWEQRVAVSQLAGESTTGIPSSVACIGEAPPNLAEALAVDALAPRTHSPMLAAASLRRRLVSGQVDILHAWGPDALRASAAARSDRGVLLCTVFDPGIADRHVELLRATCTDEHSAVICSAERVRRRLVERGVPFERCVVVRPAVDFAQIRAVDARALRAALNLAPELRWFVMPPPLAGRDGHCTALWAVLMRRHLDEPVGLVVPGCGSQIERLRAMAGATNAAGAVVFSGEQYRFEDLCAAADDLVLGDVAEIPMTAAAWAMAGNTLVSAPATYSTSEILANDLNAKLFKGPQQWRRRAAQLAARLDHDPNHAKIREVARGQAYEVFSRRRFTRQIEQVCANVLANKLPANGISDPALVGAT